ncbi:PQQ-binding-like beta-propeller repeat protein [Pelomonas sp. V22]|uniref:PilC/PilY family type IV pilus protein n=1 Tax=Pelomonas sp. V22 TaxID=2822139 RepID=UPI0024A8CD17|nr:PilC/PilY family type IV pilus protein [Pelomonas sp. V22]MDI4632689.1 PQQ-binding-like beta-propeller repeat protein [Pelomonas sp. V22]
MNASKHPNPPRRFLALALGLLTTALLPAQAGTTDIASAPLFTTSTTKVKPNVMFVLDDSGSMAWDYMPDDARFGSSNYNRVYGRRAAQCNGLAFDSTKDYVVPVNAAGADLGNASQDFLSGTYVDTASYLSSGDVNNTSNKNKLTGTTSLSVASSGSITVTVTSGTVPYYSTNGGMIVSLFGSTVPDWRGRFSYLSSAYMIGKVTGWDPSTKQLTVERLQSVGSGTIDNVYVGVGSPIDNVYYTYSGSKTKLDYVYTAAGIDVEKGIYPECSAPIGDAAGKGVFTANLVLPGSTHAKNYANWYYYYSTRIRMMKTSLTRAFSPLDERYRIGFMTINDNTDEGILNVRDFGITGTGSDAIDQKDLFYSRVNGAIARNGTPLRAALSKAGLYFAKKIAGQTYDPVQYSCQKNFTILSTDGYWNGSAGYQLDGTTAVGQQDGGATVRPMFDGGNAIVKKVETWTETSTLERTTITPYSKTDSVTTTRKIPGTTFLTKTYTRGTLSSDSGLTISSISRSCSGSYTCTVTVTTSSNHNMSTGDKAIITGTSIAAYNSSTPVTITKTGNKVFTYVISGSGAAPGTPTVSSAKIGYSPGGCPMGQGAVTRTEATYTTGILDVKRTDTVWAFTRTLVQNVATATPYTRTVTTVDGVLSSDVTTTGSPSTNTSTVSSTDSTPVSDTRSPVNGTGNGNSYTTSPVTSGSYPDGCASSAPSTTTTTTTLAAEGAPTTTTSVAPSYTAGTSSVSNGPAVNVVGEKTTTTSSTASTGGSMDSLADVAMYYYQTDLRDDGRSNCTGALGLSVCENNVKSVGADTAEWQHMSTYTLGLGVNGLLKYRSDYDTADTGDFKAIKGGTANWPAPSSDAVANIDDLWHAAVNGRGRYFSATDPTTLAASLSSALSSIDADTGSSSAAATSTLQPVEGDNGVFIAQFQSGNWTGDLRAYAMNVKTGAVPTTKLNSEGKIVDAAAWSASAMLNAAKVAARTVYYFKGGTGATGSLRAFNLANLTADGMNGYVENACSKTPALTQCGSAGTTMRDSLNSGANMVSFLRGEVQTQYRVRTAVLGDIVNSSPVYVGKPGFSYTENAYASFKSSKASRAPTLYVGANDGMLHAFDASNGDERWAYIPRLVMDKLYRLGDSVYESKHLYYVDATPVVGDVFVGGAWKTILVGGLNAGGSGYYALDVTDPANPVALWEFNDTNMGLSYGNPVITKRKDGKWVVAFTSGYNNADGLGHLFVVDAATGEKLTDLSTGIGSAGDPSGLNKLNAWIAADSDNTALRFYSGDLKGNIWRFDIDGNLEPKNSALKLGQAIKDGVPQPITTTPQLAEIEANGGKHAVVYIGTGRYLGKTDVTDAQVQTIYAVKDGLGATGLGDLRSTAAALVAQEIDDPTGSVRTVKEGHPVDWSTQNGWYLDLPSTRERINVDMQLAFSMLTAAGNIPGNTATDCDKAQDGTSYIYQLSVISGRGTAKKLSSMVAGLSTVQLADGTGVTVVTKTDASAPDPLTVPPSSMANAKARRSSWRELID